MRQSLKKSTNMTHQVNDVTEVHLDAALVEVGVSGRVVDEFGELPLSHL